MSLILQGKQLMVFITNDKIQGFQQKLEFWNTFNCHCELDKTFYTKRLLMRLVVIVAKRVFKILYNETCRHFENSYNSVT